ncbi:uncharacterized protein LOC118435864 [Folsomia candida]|uniref:uncharacterized protein LOC118435864 n=1 Tax=Folsomia candida TaxID=158441 RepID=UPI00160551FE|nr:uncharacterized protein LOC118435864 [Folsomia candida]
MVTYLLLPSSEDDTEIFLTNYTALKQLSKLINSAASLIIFFFVGEALLYYSVSLSYIFVAKNDIARFRKSIFFLNFISVLFFAGDACKSVEDLVESWTSRMVQASQGYELKRSGYLTLLLHEAKSHAVGISGHIFVLSYTSIFNFVATMVTYFVICSTIQG